MTARQCPVPMCGAAVRQGHLMCRDCWSRVPRPLQAAVNQSWALYRQRLMPGMADARVAARKGYDNACAGAIGAAEESRP